MLAPGIASPLQPRSKSSVPKKQQSSRDVDGDERPIFINHGDINININFNGSVGTNE